MEPVTFSPVYGLILAGGKSSRMGEDKALLNYHGVSQIEFCRRLLEQVCVSVYISNRADQSGIAEHNRAAQIHDKYNNIGPIGGILTAMEKFPESAWFVLACDLPFITVNTLNSIFKNRDPERNATTYKCVSKPGPEPLCGIYEPSLKFIINESIKEGITCPRKILSRAEVKLIEPDKAADLLNINDQGEYQKAKKDLAAYKININPF